MRKVVCGRSERLRNHKIFRLLICLYSYQFAIHGLLKYLLVLRTCMHHYSNLVKVSLSRPVHRYGKRMFVCHSKSSFLYANHT